jgi:hypothetical protein
MENETDIEVTAHWRLRYAAFLCAVFDMLSTILLEDVSLPSEFAKRYASETEERSPFLAKIIDISVVSFLTQILVDFFLNVCDTRGMKRILLVHTVLILA